MNIEDVAALIEQELVIMEEYEEVLQHYSKLYGYSVEEIQVELGKIGIF